MPSDSAIVSRLVILGMILGALQCSGCGPSGTDAVKFANQRISQLKAEKRQVVQGDNGKWYSEAIEIRDATPGFKQDGELSTIQSMVSYEFRMLRSKDCDTESEARDADLSPVNEAWQSKKELFILKDGEWKRKE